MRALLISLQFCFLTFVVTNTCRGDDTVDLINRHLMSIKSSPQPAAPSQDSPQRNKVSNEERKSVRIATAPKSVMSLSDENLKQPTQIAHDGPVSVDGNALEAQRVRAEADINRRMSALESSLSREENTLNTRLAALGKQREVALQKEDEKLLKQIEQAERQAITEYESRVQRLLDSAMSTTKQPSNPSVDRQQATSGAAQRTAPTAATKPRSPVNSEDTSKRRRFKLWPFN